MKTVIDAGDREHVVACETPLAAIYDRIAAGGATILSTGNVVPDPLPIEGGDRWGLSVVFRPREWSPKLTRTADQLARLLGPSHVVYRPDAWHVTLRQFEGHRADIAHDDARMGSYRDVLASFAVATPPVSIAFRGLAASSTGIVVKGWPTTDLQRLRLGLHERLKAAGVPMAGPERDRDTLRASAHASLAIFGGPIDRPDALAAFIGDHASTDFGTFVFDDLWIVGYRRTRASVTLIEYGRIALA